MRDVNEISRFLGERLANVFLLYVGQGKPLTYAVLAARTGIGESSLREYSRGEASPSGAALLAIISKLPPEAGDMLIEPSGYRLRPIETTDDPWSEIGAEASLLTYEIFEAKKDGNVDHVETLKLRKRCRTLDAKLAGVLQ